MTPRAVGALVSASALALALAACSGGSGGSGGSGDEPAPPDGDRIVLSPPSPGAEHTHAPGQEHGGPPLGDGLSATAGGYRMSDVTLPAVGGPGEMSFRIEDPDGAVLRDYVEEQTKLLHLYVVRADLSDFRHLHPTLGDDGTWRTRVDLGEPGAWRVVAELTPGGTTQAVVLGTTVAVGEGEDVPVPDGEEAASGDDGVVRVRMLAPGEVSDNGRLRLAVTDLDGAPLTLGSYLGASAHLTGFSFGEGAAGGFVHVHPYGAPEVTDDGTVLTFHTTFTEPGTYRMFVQVRVDGLLHQLAVTTTVV